MLLLAAALGAPAQQVVPDFYKEAGLYPTREYVNQHVQEHIDPFNGSLQIHSVDVFIPGQGGLDLRVLRSYNSNNINPANPAALETQSHVGLGWNIHFGRVLRLGSNPLCGINSADGRDDPVLELPDGSRQKLYFTGATPNLLSTRLWRTDCIPAGNQSMRVFSPDGLRYDMTLLATVMAGAPTIRAWYATRITDSNGNYISINYTTTATIPRISYLLAGDGRRVDFTYSASTGLIETIVAPAGIWRYDYILLGTSGRHALSRVTRPDGTFWQYDHSAFVAAGSADNYQLRTVTYPQGGTITYAYTLENFNPAGGNLAQRTVAVRQKDVNSGAVTGRWTFVYRPSAVAGVDDATEVSTPAGLITYRHYGATTATNGFVWKIGILTSKQIGNEQAESYEWERGNLISTTDNLRDGFFGVRDTETYSARMTRKTVNRGGAVFTTVFSAFDVFDNPWTITETGSNGGDRSTSYTYTTRRSFGTGDADRWLLRLALTETLFHQGLQAGLIQRDFDDSGNLLFESRDGVRTDYTPFSPPTGDVWRVTRPRGLVSTFTDYFRGIPRSEVHAAGFPEQVTISRVVSHAGNVESETDGEGRARGYQYDGLNRLKLITPPPNSTNPLAPTQIDYTATTKTAARGSAPALVQHTTYDGFGRVRTVSLGGVTTTYVHDAMGRLVYVSYPDNPNVGTTYEYDQLDRLRFVRHPDNSFIQRSFPDGARMSVRDERGHVTTYVYRAYGNPDQQYLMQVQAPTSVANAGASISRNGRDLVTRITQDGVARTYGYDARYYLVCASLPEILADGVNPPDCASNPSGNVIRYGRDAAGNMTSRTVGSSGMTTFEYDQRNRLWKTNYPSVATPSVVRTYSKTDKLRTVSSATGVRAIEYDANDNVVQETLAVDSQQLVAIYRYNDKEQLRGVRYPISNREITYGLDALGRARSIDGVLNDVQYWPSGQIRSITYANGVRTEYGQDVRLRPGSLKVQRGTAVAEIDQIWSFDTANNVDSITDSVDGTFNRGFGYDALNRLQTADAPGMWGNGTIDYDGRGNIRSQSFGAFALSYTYGATNNRLARIDGSAGATYQYDVYGNVSNRSGATLDFDDASNLRCFNCAFSNRIAYGYDGSNQRLWVERGSARSYEFWTFTGKLLAEYTPSRNNEVTEYIYLTNKRIAQRTIDSRTATTTSLTVTPSTAETNQTVTLSATVLGGSPSGTVSFREAGVEIAAGQLNGGVATAPPTSFGVAGTRRISAYYAGNGSTGPSVSAPVEITITQAPVNTTTSVSTTVSQPFDVRTCVPVSAVISGNGPTGTATMTFPGQKGPRSAALVAGRAVFESVRLPAGTVVVTVSYSGDARNRPSTGQLTLNVGPWPEGWVGIVPPCGTWRVLQPPSVNASRQGAGVVSGSTSVTTDGGAAPFTYAWSRATGSTAISVSGGQTATFSASLAAGTTASATYNVTVTDNTGDSGSVSVGVSLSATAPPPPALSVTISPTSLSASRRGPGTVTASATASATGGVAPITYAWTQLSGSAFTLSGPSSATATFSADVYAAWCEEPVGALGMFRVTARDAAGQTATKDLQVSFSASPAGPPPADCALLRTTKQSTK